jgi:transposase-like protein
MSENEFENDPYEAMEEKYQHNKTYCPNSKRKHKLEKVDTSNGEHFAETVYRCSICGYEDVF